MNTTKLMANFVNALIENSESSFLTIPKNESICVEHTVKSRFCEDFSFKIIIEFGSKTSFQAEVLSEKPDLNRYERILNNTIDLFKFYTIGRTLFIGWSMICEDLDEVAAASVLARTFDYMTYVLTILPGLLFQIEENDDHDVREAIDQFLKNVGDSLEKQLINLMSEDDDDFDPDDFLVDFDYE